MFLFPSFGAFSTDILLLLIYHERFHSVLKDTLGVWNGHVNDAYDDYSIDNVGEGDMSKHIGSLRLFLPFSIIRLLLLLPIMYHTFSGTRLRFSFVYYIFHALSAVVIFGQFVFGNSQNGEEQGTLSSLNESSQHHHQYHTTREQIRLLLSTLSLFSMGLHVLLIRHVRSSAPPTGFILRREKSNMQQHAYQSKRKVLAYWVWDRYRSRYSVNAKVPDPEQGLRESSLSDGLYNSINNDEDVASSYNDLVLLNENEIRLSNSDCYDSNEDEDVPLFSTSPSTKSNETRKRSHNDIYRNMTEIRNFVGYDDFLSEIRLRFQQAKLEWRGRLEKVTRRIQNQHTTENGTSVNSNNFFLGAHNHSPFQALLQLYAYEEVFLNSKLDQAFPNNKEGNLSLSFYAPQLLCFLLHNAYLNTGYLETWILKKCERNVYFAHRCFWFLRSWCRIDKTHQPLNCNNNFLGKKLNYDTRSGDWDEQSSKTLNNVKTNGILPSKLPTDSGNPSLEQATESDEQNGLKFSLREYKLLGKLLSRIIKCGEYAAIQLQERHNEAENGCQLSPKQSSIYLSNKTDFTPSALRIGCPSKEHLAAVTSKTTVGFHPCDELGEILTTEKSNYFLRTPDFLESLITIADGLMHLPKSARTSELRERLKEVETKYLPANTVYVPINNCMHRVWRIVASESIALSTNERVPCIICLEVVDCESEQVQQDNKKVDNHVINAKKLLTTQKNSKSDSEILTDWIMKPRPPQRHNSLLHKVTNTFRKLRSDIKDTIHHQEMILMGSPISSGYDDIDNQVDYKKTFPLTGLEIGNNRLGSRLTHTSSSMPCISKDDQQHNSKSPIPSLFQDKIKIQTTESHLLSQEDKLGQWISKSPKKGLAEESFLLNDNDKVLPHADPSMLCDAENLGLSPLETEIGQWMSKSIPVNDTVSGNNLLNHDLSDISSLERNVENNHIMEVSTKYASSEIDKYADDSSISHEEISHTPSLESPQKYGSTKATVPIDKKEKVEVGDVVISSNRPPPVVFKEDWNTKEERIRVTSVYGTHPKWRLLPVLIKSNDDLRQEQLASQIIHCMANILSRGKISVYLYPYEIIALTHRAGIIEAIPDTISIDSLKKNHPDFTDIKSFYEQHFGSPGCDQYEDAKANFVESLSAYSIVCFLLQIKDRHNGNILLDNKGHLIHIDFGFFFLSSPGGNSAFESAPFKLTRDFVELMDGPDSHTFNKFRELCYQTFLELRRHCYQITLLIEMLMEGNEDLGCFCQRPHDAIQGLQERFRLELNDKACSDYVNLLIDESLENWTTTCYDKYQRWCVGVM